MDWMNGNFFGGGFGAEMEPPEPQECSVAERTESSQTFYWQAIGVCGNSSGAAARVSGTIPPHGAAHSTIVWDLPLGSLRRNFIEAAR